MLQDDALEMVDEAEELTDALRTQVLFAREYLKSVTIGPKQVRHALVFVRSTKFHCCCLGITSKLH